MNENGSPFKLLTRSIIVVLPDQFITTDYHFPVQWNYDRNNQMKCHPPPSSPPSSPPPSPLLLLTVSHFLPLFDPNYFSVSFAARWKWSIEGGRGGEVKSLRRETPPLFPLYIYIYILFSYCLTSFHALPLPCPPLAPPLPPLLPLTLFRRRSLRCYYYYYYYDYDCWVDTLCDGVDLGVTQREADGMRDWIVISIRRLIICLKCRVEWNAARAV